MEVIPSWLGAVGVLIVIASGLGAAVAAYRTSVQGTSLRETRSTISDLRGEVTDYERREVKLESAVKVLQAEKRAANDRIKILEDLITKRKDDDAIRADLAEVKRAVDENVIGLLTAIFQLLEDNATSTESGKP